MPYDLLLALHYEGTRSEQLQAGQSISQDWWAAVSRCTEKDQW